MFSAHIDAKYQDFPELCFFGLGNDSGKSEEESFFAQETVQVISDLSLKPSHYFELTGNVGWLQAEATAGEGSASPAIFDPVELPGFGTGKTEHVIYGGKSTFHLWDRWGWPPVGVRLTFEGWRYDDWDQNLYDTVKLVGQLEAHLPIGYRNRRLAFRFRTAHMQADNGKQVPFYLMETIGGARTVRGYAEYRFRDRRNLLMTAEYRWEVWPYLDFAFFGDGGKVFSDFEDFDLSDLHYGYGWGVRIRAPGPLLLNVDLARSNEGFVLHIGGGPRF
jgi:hypothetical protein